MIRWFLQRSARAFGREYQYDVSFMLDVIETSRSAGFRLSLFAPLTGYRGPKQAGGVVLGAHLASIMDGDCGPCAQLVIDMARKSGAPMGAVRACLQGDMQAAGDIGLGYQFAQAAIAADPRTDQLSLQVAQKYGRKAVIAASFAAATGRFYPVFKRGLGHGQACQKLRFGDGDDLLVTSHG